MYYSLINCDTTRLYLREGNASKILFVIPADSSNPVPRLTGNPVVITRVEEPHDIQHRKRVRKYLLIMSVRVPALLLAALAYSITHNGWLAMAIIAVSIPLPWVAVLVANDRPARAKNEMQAYKYDRNSTMLAAHQENQLPPTASIAHSIIEETPPETMNLRKFPHS